VIIGSPEGDADLPHAIGEYGERRAVWDWKNAKKENIQVTRGTHKTATEQLREKKDRVTCTII